jgi:hypothetical protein
MHYITNTKNQIIAADEEFLNLLSIDDLTQIYTLIFNDELTLEFAKDNTLSIKTSLIQESYEVEKIKLHGLIGDIYLIVLKEVKSLAISDEIETASEDTKQDGELFDNLLDDIAIEEPITKEEDQDAISLIDDTNIEENQDNKDNVDISDDELFDLLLDSDDSESELISDISNTNVKEESVVEDEEILDLFGDTQTTLQDEAEEVKPQEQQEESQKQEDITPIVLNIKTLSQTIGISEYDYKQFLDEYISTAKSLKDDMSSDDDEKRNSAISTLSHLSNVLHLPVIGDILNKFENTNKSQLKSVVKELYSTISRLSIDSDNVKITKDNKAEETPQIELLQEETKQEESQNTHKIDLSDIKPIHFDFSMEEAANELSLPVDLIEEFVNDFIDQAHEETEKMLTAYDEGDLDRVNKIGHLLKGTSSNLRIVPLADTLYKIQFCESLDELEPLIKDYWGHFLAFENHIKLRTK